MNALTAYITAKDAERNLHWCPCCRDRNAASDMDMSNAWEHSQAMRAKFGAACCNACVDDYTITEDGVLMPYADVVPGFDHIWSSQEALDEAIAEASYQDADRAMYRSWM